MSRNVNVNDREPRRLPRQLGSLPPLYKFFLNPNRDRFTNCPSCCSKTKQRKKPLAVHVFDFGMVILNKTCRFCPACDLLIAHRNEIDAQLAQLFANLETPAIGNDYLVVGTVEREDWRRGLAKPLSNAEMLAALHDFQDHQNYERAFPGQDIPRGEGPPNPR